jgi:hypothetical protein
MAITCGSRLATSLFQDNASSLASRTDIWRVSSPSLSQHRQGSGGLRTGRLPALSVVRLLKIYRVVLCYYAVLSCYFLVV